MKWGLRVINVQNHASAFNSLWGMGNRRIEKATRATWQHFCTHLVDAIGQPMDSQLGSLRLFKGIASFFPVIAEHAAFAAGNCPLLPFLH